MNSIIRTFVEYLRRLYYMGKDHECPVCKSNVRLFKRMGARKGARCPVCGSLERHRLIWLFCIAHTDLFDGKPKRLLHVAPESCMNKRLTGLDGIDYLGTDVESRRATVKMDVTAIQFPSASFDIILCNHVLEHVQDDTRAMRELHRVLRPGGWAILQVPIKGDVTQERVLNSPEERAHLYGQSDHVRQYGRDYATRLRNAGFIVEVSAFAAELSPDERERYGISADEEIYYCRTPG